MGMAATESQFHVLAVDDSLLDRKLIERLLKTSSYQGNFLFFFVWRERNFFLENSILAQWVFFFCFLITGSRIFLVFCFCSWQLLQLILVVRLLSFWVFTRMTKSIQILLLFSQILIRYCGFLGFLLLFLPTFFPFLSTFCIIFLSAFLKNLLFFCCCFAGSGSESYYYRLLYARHDRLRSAKENQGMVFFFYFFIFRFLFVSRLKI